MPLIGIKIPFPSSCFSFHGIARVRTPYRRYAGDDHALFSFKLMSQGQMFEA
jgi:hypothetical protein